MELENYKRRFYFFLLIFICSNIYAQPLKKAEFTLVASPTVNWFIGGNTDIMKSNVGKIGFSGGGTISISRKNISFVTGLLFEIARFNVKYNNYGIIFYSIKKENFLNICYLYSLKDNNIMDNANFFGNRQNWAHGTDNNLIMYQLNSREYTIYYATIPLLFVFKEKLSNGFDAIAGVNCSFLLNAYANDNVSKIIIDNQSGLAVLAGGDENLKHLNVTKEIYPVQLKLKIGISNSTKISNRSSFYYGVNYLLGITKPIQKYSRQIEYMENDTSWRGAKGGGLRQTMNSSTIEVSLGLQW